MRAIFIAMLVLAHYSAFGQKVSEIKINATGNKSFNLSEIAEKPQAITIRTDAKNGFDRIADVVWADDYVYLGVYSIENGKQMPTRILQYDTSGKFIRKVCEFTGSVGEIYYDNTRKQLIAIYGWKAYCYDLSGNLKSTQPTGSHTGGFCHNGELLLKNMDKNHYFLFRHDMADGKETPVYDFVDNDAFNVGEAFAGVQAEFSVKDGDAVVAFGVDNTIYRVEEKSVTPIVKFRITPDPILPFDKLGYYFQGYIGDWLCIHYARRGVHYLYLKNTDTGREFKTKYSDTEGIVDDYYNTGVCKLATPLNRAGYFYFVKHKVWGTERSV